MSETNKPKEKATAAGTDAAKRNKRHHYHVNSAYAQRQRMVEWFKTSNSLTTEQARRELDIMHPAGRIRELRRRGYDILTYWANFPTHDGNIHRMARYVCMNMSGVPMDKEPWLQELYGLLERFSDMGITPDIASMGIVELWGVYCFLKRLTGE